MEVLGLISDTDAKKRHVPGMERTISKAKGSEFGSLLHQLGADFFTSPWGSKVRTILVEIEPAAKDRLPKRSVKAEGPPPPAPTAAVKRTGPPPAPPSQPPALAPETAAEPAKKKKGTRAAEPEPATDAPAARAERKPAKEAAPDPPLERRSPTKQLTRKKPR